MKRKTSEKKAKEILCQMYEDDIYMCVCELDEMRRQLSQFQGWSQTFIQIKNEAMVALDLRITAQRKEIESIKNL
jgi:hypothetical protein